MCVGIHMLMCNKTTRREEQQPETDRHIDRHSGGGRRGGGEEEGKGSGIREWQGGGDVARHRQRRTVLGM